ncbi:MAG: hypothetical protein KH328_01515 [Staphylococcus sp.]|nr:hypothetical protein [Staphylococcus sp.]
MSKFVQVGVTALRGPDGTYLPSVKLYVEVPDNKDENKMENNMVTDFAGLSAKKYREYVEQVKEE